MRLLATCLTVALWTAPAAADEVASPVEQLRVRLSQLRGEAPNAAYVRTAIEQADLALSRAEQAKEAGKVEAETRALRIAEAATVLAERRAALLTERRLARVTAERRRAVEAELDRLAKALSAARAGEREQPARDEGGGSAPKAPPPAGDGATP
jgi:hypothetical protein